MKKYIGFIFALLIAVLITTAAAIWQGLQSFVFAWILNCMLMLAGLSMTQTFKPRLSSDYFNSKKWENEGKIYKWVGVNIFRALLVRVGWEKLNKAANPVKKNLKALKHLEYATRESEFGHLVIFFIVLGIAFFVGFYYGFAKSLWLHFLNVICHLYPIATQRYNRPRLQKVINRGHAKRAVA